MKPIKPLPKITTALLEAASAKGALHPCGLATFLRTLQPDEMAAVYRALESPAIRATAIAAVLIERGFKLNPQAVRRHRVNGCKVCARQGLKS